MSNETTAVETLQLISPYGGEPAIFNVHVDVKIPDETNEIIQIIKFISEENKDVKEILENFSATKKLQRDFESMQSLCNEFNKWSSQMHAKALESLLEKTRCSKKQIKYLMSLIYNRAVQEPGKLNQYEAFSPEVYGETGFDIIDQMLNRVPLSANDIFLDLGSGVGNVVLHVAAVSNCKTCYGFEKAEWPAKYAELMEKEFIFWMNFFGKSYSNFKIYKADFLSDEESVLIDTVSPPKNSTMNEYVREVINEAKLVFVNNYAFGAEVDHQLKLRFCNMTEGAFIISSKPFCPLNFRINSRNLNDIGTIINFSDFEPLCGHVSWTDKIINYYFQKIDRTLLEKYFEKRKNPLAICAGKKDDEKAAAAMASSKIHSPTGSTSSTTTRDSYESMSPSSSSSSSTSSVSTHSDALSTTNENNGGEMTTRRRRREKSKDSRKKRKATHSYSDNSSSPPPNSSSRRHVNKITTKDKQAKKTNASKLKIRSKSVERTLDEMHTNINKKTSSKPETLLKVSQKVVNPTSTSSSVNGQTTHNHQQKSHINKNDKTVSKNFNLNSLTSLAHANLNDQLFKDLKITSNMQKKLNLSANNERSGLTSNHSNNLNRKNDNRNSLKLNEDFDEKSMRPKLGDEMVNAVEDYFKKVKKNYYRYLCHLNSIEYKEKINSQIKNEKKLNTELLVKEVKLRQHIEHITKVNVELIKQRAFELGIKDLKTPHELINYAQEILSEHQKLVIKKEKTEKEIEQLELKCQRDNKHTNSMLNKKIKLDEDDVVISSSMQKNNQQQQQQQKTTTTILNKLLNVIDSKNVENLNLNLNNSNHKNTKSNLNVNNCLKTIPYESHSSSEKENLNSDEKNNAGKIRDEQINTTSLKSPIDDDKSIESMSTNDGTLTATERGDYENDEALCDVITDETSEDRSPLFHHDDSSPTPISNANTTSNKNNEIPIKKKTPSSQTSKQQKNLSSMCSSSKVGLSDVNLKNFKIPKQNNSNTSSKVASASASSSSPTKSNKNNQLSNEIKNEPGETLMMSMSLEFNQNLNAALSSSSSNKIMPSSSNCESPSLSISSVNSQNYDYAPSASSSSSSPSISSASMQAFDFNNQKSTNYYHPKKNQFRQYMMESNSTKTNVTNSSSSTTSSTDNNNNASSIAMASNVIME